MNDTLTRADALTATIRIAATPAQVFPYFTEPRLFTRWLGDTAELDAHPGGVFAVNVGDNRVRGAYVAVEPPHRVVFTWGVPDSAALPPGSSTVEVLLSADGDETLVEVFHYGLPAAERPAHETGWAACLAALRQAAASEAAQQ